MNDSIRAVVEARLREKGMTRADVARALERTPQEITRALNGTQGGAGKVPVLWADLLALLDLELTARPQPSAAQK